MRQLILLLLVCFSMPLVAQSDKKTYTCKTCFADRRLSGYSVSEMAENIGNDSMLLSVYQDVENYLAVKQGWAKYLPNGVVTLEQTKELLRHQYVDTMTWDSGIVVASIYGDSVAFVKRKSFQYSSDSKGQVHREHGPEYVYKQDITAIWDFYDDNGNPFPLAVTGCACCQNAAKDKRYAIVPQKSGSISGGGADPGASGGVEKPEKKDTVWIPEVGPIVTSSGKKPTSWQEQEYERQQKKEKQQGTKPAFDSLSFLSNGGNYISNSFNTTNTYVFPGGSQSQDESDGQYVYSRGSWVPASYVSDYGGPRVRLYAGLRVAYGVSNYPPYCPSGLPYDGYWDGHYYRSALDGRTLAQDNRGNWQYQGGPSPNVDYSVLNQNRYKPETTGYTSNSYHPSTHNGGYYGPRRF